MFLKSISLQNFRNYSKSEFTFNKNTTVIVGPNTSGKTNLLEATYLLATGKSFKAEKDVQVVRFGEQIGRVKGILESRDGQETALEVVVTTGELGETFFRKKYLLNGVAKRKVDFAGNLAVVVFSPIDIAIVVDSPGLRRQFLDHALLQVDRDYRLAMGTYAKALRQRNALLQQSRETGKDSGKQFAYWDAMLIESGGVVTTKREEFIAFLNSQPKDVFDFVVFYDKSIISKERLLQYKDAQARAGVTLVGPHRDDFSVSMFSAKQSDRSTHDVRLYGSRGQQRLVILQLKLLELAFMEKRLGQRPILLLDDIFSELDRAHIYLVSEMIDNQQTILTTTHKEFIDKKFLKDADMVELG